MKQSQNRPTITEKNLKKPFTYRETFEILSEEELVILEEFKKFVKKLFGEIKV